jgi:hypothetical protein
VYWPAVSRKAMFEVICERDEIDPEVRVAELLGPDAHMDEFLTKVQTNLQAQPIRLVFAADTIPPEPRRIIEFLNLQMSPAEVIGVEVKQYVGENAKTLVPRFVGQIEEAQQRTAAAPSTNATKWSWELYDSELNLTASRTAIARARREDLCCSTQPKRQSRQRLRSSSRGSSRWLRRL